MRNITPIFGNNCFNYYFDENRQGHDDVVSLFEAVRAGRYAGYTSEYVVQELKKAPQLKREEMIQLIELYGVTLLEPLPKISCLAESYIESGIIPASHLYDSLHIAAAVIYELDCVISYNFHHINRFKTKLLTAGVNNREGYGAVTICTAGEVLHYERDGL